MLKLNRQGSSSPLLGQLRPIRAYPRPPPSAWVGPVISQDSAHLPYDFKDIKSANALRILSFFFEVLNIDGISPVALPFCALTWHMKKLICGAEVSGFFAN